MAGQDSDVFKTITIHGSQWQGRTRSRGLGWRIHGSVEDTKLSTNKQHSLSEGGEAQRKCVRCMQRLCGGFGTRRPSSLRHFVRRPRGGRSAFYYQVEYVNGFYAGPKHSIYFTRTRTPSHDHAHTHSQPTQRSAHH